MFWAFFAGPEAPTEHAKVLRALKNPKILLLDAALSNKLSANRSERQFLVVQCTLIRPNNYTILYLVQCMHIWIYTLDIFGTGLYTYIYITTQYCEDLCPHKANWCSYAPTLQQSRLRRHACSDTLILSHVSSSGLIQYRAQFHLRLQYSFLFHLMSMLALARNV